MHFRLRREKIHRWFIIFAFLAVLTRLVGFNPAQAAQKGRVLALYKSSENADARNNAVKTYLAPYLKNLGYRVDYRDAMKPLPGDDEMKKYDAVVTFYWSGIHPRPKEYARWLVRQLRQKRKVIIVGNYGAHTADEKTWLGPEDLNDFFSPFGAPFAGSEKVDLDNLKIKSLDSRMMTSRPDISNPWVLLFKSDDDRNRNYLVLGVQGKPGVTTAPIVKTPFGALALGGFSYTVNNKTGQIKWHVDRQKFLSDALSGKYIAPAPAKRLLALYKSSEGQNEENNFIKRFASGRLKKLKYTIDYRDIEKGFPSDTQMERYSGIITWFTTSEMKNAPQYCRWLAKQAAQGKKTVILGNFGAYGEKVIFEEGSTIRYLGGAEFNNFFYPFGLRMDGLWTNDKKDIAINKADPAVFNRDKFKSPQDFRDYLRFKSLSSENRVYLSLKRTDVKNSDSAVIVTTPRGGMAMQGYIFKQDPKTWEITFLMDMDAFLKAALQPEEVSPPKTFGIKVDPQKQLNIAKAMPRPLIPTDTGPGKISRKVLILYKGAEAPSFVESRFYQFSGPVLNHLGLVPEYHDVEKRLPSDAEMAKYYAVLTWFSDPAMKNADKYNAWLARQMDNGKKVVILGNYGALYEAGSFAFAPGAKKVFRRMGTQMIDEFVVVERNLDRLKDRLLTYRSAPVFDPQVLNLQMGRTALADVFYFDNRVVWTRKGYFNYEKPLNVTGETYIMPVVNKDEANAPLMEVYGAVTGVYQPAVTGKWGGFILGDFFFKESEPVKTSRARAYKQLLSLRFDTALTSEKNNGYWIVNPIKFLNRALDLKDMPRPDYTTLNGQRIFYTHVDGDGLLNMSYINRTKTAGEIILERVFKKFNLPITASVITEEIEKHGEEYYNRGLITGREIFALDNVEIASHSHTHPYNLTRGDLQIDLQSSRGVQRDYDIEFLKADPKREVLYSTALINQNMAPAGKALQILLWTGMCNPDPALLKETDRLRIQNLNGGDPIYDEKHKSISNLAPIFTIKDGYIQVHTSGSNDYIYTNSWTGNYGGMKELVNHFRNTGEPIRLLPMNVYYHYYSGVYDESLEAVTYLYDYCKKQRIAPIFASQYAKIVDDFCHVKIASTGDGGYVIKNAGHLRTIRFDNEKRSPDMEKSTAIIGFNRANGDLYVHLDESKEHKIYLSDKPVKTPYLVTASHYVDGWSAKKDNVTAVMSGMSEGYAKIDNLRPNTIYNIKVGDMAATSTTDKSGRLEFEYNLGGKPGKYDFSVKAAK